MLLIKGDIILKDGDIANVTQLSVQDLLPSGVTVASTTTNDENNQLQSSDPRKVTNLIDGINLTRDDLHSWLTSIDVLPTTIISTSHTNKQHPSSSEHQLHIPLTGFQIDFHDLCTVSMIRIFNYNKSRTHSTRGVRHCCLLIPGSNTILFDGYVYVTSLLSNVMIFNTLVLY